MRSTGSMKAFRGFLILSILWSTGCRSTEGDPFQPAPRSYSHAVVYIIGDSWAEQPLRVNSEPDRALHFGAYHVLQLSPGRHRITVGDSRWSLDVEAGGQYILKVTHGSLRTGTFEHLSMARKGAEMGTADSPLDAQGEKYAALDEEIILDSTDVRDSYNIWKAERRRARGGPTALPAGAEREADLENHRYRELLFGVSGSYQNLLAGPRPGSSFRTIDGARGTESVSNLGYSFFMKTTPSALSSHTFYDYYFNMSQLESQNRGKYLQARIAELGAGLYVSSGDLYRGDVNFYAGVLLGARSTYLEGNFNFGRGSLYQAYLLDTRNPFTASGVSGLDHIDVLNLSRRRSGTLDDERRLRYLLFKAGSISREDYIISDIALSPRIAPEFLTLLWASGLSLNEIHRLYGGYLESSEKSDLYHGLSLDLELGYMGDHYLIRYRASLPAPYKSKNGQLFIESHNLMVGVFWRF